MQNKQIQARNPAISSQQTQYLQHFALNSKLIKTSAFERLHKNILFEQILYPYYPFSWAKVPLIELEKKHTAGKLIEILFNLLRYQHIFLVNFPNQSL